MERLFFYILVIVVFVGCVDKRSKSEFKTSFRTCESLYIELYRVYGSGALGGDLLSAYLTDATSFRKYLGTFDDADGGYYCECKGDSIVVGEVSKKSTSIKTGQVGSFSLSELKKKGEYE